jgi:hypothetical protein
VRFDERSGFFALDREESVVAVNFGREPLRVPLSRDESLRPAELLCATEGAEIEDSTLVLPRESLLVVTLSRAGVAPLSNDRSREGRRSSSA